MTEGLDRSLTQKDTDNPYYVYQLILDTMYHPVALHFFCFLSDTLDTCVVHPCKSPLSHKCQILTSASSTNMEKKQEKTNSRLEGQHTQLLMKNKQYMVPIVGYKVK